MSTKSGQLHMLGHGGYLETCRRALVHTLRANGVGFERGQVDRFMQEAWMQPSPYPDALEGLRRLRGNFRLAALSNGELHYLAHLAEHRIGFDFDRIISVDFDTAHFL